MNSILTCDRCRAGAVALGILGGAMAALVLAAVFAPRFVAGACALLS